MRITVLILFGVVWYVASQIGRVHDLIKIILISYCMIDNDNKLIVIYFGLKS